MSPVSNVSTDGFLPKHQTPPESKELTQHWLTIKSILKKVYLKSKYWRANG